MKLVQYGGLLISSEGFYIVTEMVYINISIKF